MAGAVLASQELFGGGFRQTLFVDVADGGQFDVVVAQPAADVGLSLRPQADDGHANFFAGSGTGDGGEGSGSESGGLEERATGAGRGRAPGEAGEAASLRIAAILPTDGENVKARIGLNRCVAGSVREGGVTGRGGDVASASGPLVA